MSNRKIPVHVEQAVAVDGLVVLDPAEVGPELEYFLHARKYNFYYGPSLERSPALRIAARSDLMLEERIALVTGVAVHHLEPTDTFLEGQ